MMKLIVKVVFLLLLNIPMLILGQGNEHKLIKEVYDVTYYEGEDADKEKHKLNLFIPNHVENPPMMLWIHGGAWAFGDRKGETELARKFAKEGIAVAAISYRLSPGTWVDPEHTSGIEHPEHIRDVARAFAWVYQQADEYKYDKHSIFVSGYSAGGHLSALLALDPDYLTEVGQSVRDVKGAIPIAGAYDIAAYYKTHLEFNGKDLADGHVKGAFGKTIAQLEKASPTLYVENQWVPMLVISETQSYDYTRLLETACESKGNDVMEFFHVKDMNHKELYENLSKSLKSDYRDIIVNYIKRERADYQYVQTRDVKLAYKVFGTGTPLFLLNGGPGFPSHHFADLAKKLSEKYQVVLFDQRGTGYSSIEEKNNSTITLDLMVQDLENLRKHLNYDEIIVMGHSFGGIYAMNYAAAYPEHVKKMILSHSGGMEIDMINDVGQRLRSNLNEKDRADLNGLSQDNLNPNIYTMRRAKIIAPAYVYNKELATSVFKGLAFKSRFYPEVNLLVYQDMRNNRMNLTKEMQSFKKPVLIIHGANDIVNPDVARHADKTFPDSKLLILDECAHYGWLEKPSIYFGTIYDFLEAS
ncbi:alpha/beta fold hydrolase [Flavobacteriaceae bacterium R38]|nr:alpha/beta fold hydrolase [Flavobacteriaceae bacterium R38]